MMISRAVQLIVTDFRFRGKTIIMQRCAFVPPRVKLYIQISQISESCELNSTVAELQDVPDL